jgi:uncharacterized protein YgbK (DUF1537 family)
VVIDAIAAARDPDDVHRSAIEAIRDELAAQRIPIVSAGHDPDAVAAAQRDLGVAGAAAVIESVLARVALASVAELGVRRLLVAGGETSGAVTRALGIRALRLTERVDPGVAWGTARATAVEGGPTVGLLLKSGNFGGEDLLTRAWEAAP